MTHFEELFRNEYLIILAGTGGSAPIGLTFFQEILKYVLLNNSEQGLCHGIYALSGGALPIFHTLYPSNHRGEDELVIKGWKNVVSGPFTLFGIPCFGFTDPIKHRVQQYLDKNGYSPQPSQGPQVFLIFRKNGITETMPITRLNLSNEDLASLIAGMVSSPFLLIFPQYHKGNVLSDAGDIGQNGITGLPVVLNTIHKPVENIVIFDALGILGRGLKGRFPGYFHEEILPRGDMQFRVIQSRTYSGSIEQERHTVGFEDLMMTLIGSLLSGGIIGALASGKVKKVTVISPYRSNHQSGLLALIRGIIHWNT